MEKKSKLVLAVLQGSDSDNTIRNLNERGFMVTVLSSTGGFLKKKSTTVMIGVEEDRLEEALDVLQKYAGHRKETVYQSVTMPHGEMSAVPPVPMEVMAGGAAVFIESLDDIRKFLIPASQMAKKTCAAAAVQVFFAHRREARQPCRAASSASNFARSRSICF